MNFCFWPSTTNLEYDVLATALKVVLERDDSAFDAAKLEAVTAETLRGWLGDNDLPMMEERVAKVREVGAVLRARFGGLAANLVASANGSAVALVDAVTANFPGFRDHSVYDGRQVFFYKRAQIVVADVWAACGCQRLPGPPAEGATVAPLGAFYDIDALTMFADYRVPQFLRAVGVLTYTDDLAAKIDGKVELCAGSHEEVELRAATIVATDLICAAVNAGAAAASASAGAAPRVFAAVEVDRLLWREGERRNASGEIPTHHRTLTCFY